MKVWARSAARLWVATDLADRTAEWPYWCGPSGVRRLEESAAAENRVLGEGRGAAHAVQIQGAAGVWRKNRHGGALGSLMDDRYSSPARLQAEVSLSERLRGLGLPTPQPLLALAVRSGGWWRQHLVTEEITDARTVYEVRDRANAVEAAGRLLARLFEAGLWATDLHPDNLLWRESDGGCWVIDLAGAELRAAPLGARDVEARVARFLRYIEKHAGGLPMGCEDALRRGLGATATS